MDELTKVMSEAKLLELREEHKDIPSVVTLVDGILATRKVEAEQLALNDRFTKDVEKLIGKLAHPEAIHNVYIRWCEVEVKDTSQEPEAVEITNPDTNEVTIEQRYPKGKVWKWVVELNKGFTVASGGNGGSGQPTASKRAISVYKFNGATNDFIGNFANASKATDYMEILVGGDSATRVLARDGYIVQPYTGTDYTS